MNPRSVNIAAVRGWIGMARVNVNTVTVWAMNGGGEPLAADVSAVRQKTLTV